MERSMVQELNGLSSSQFINNRSTFISTAFNEGDYELRKYPFLYADLEFRTCLATEEKTFLHGLILLSFSNLSKLKGFQIKSKHLGLPLRMRKGKISMSIIMKSKYANSLKNVLLTNVKENSIEIKSIN